jgi:adenosyl cobinamide kinase/adenosyl cobinamide phosphate guanylyltransferase
MDFDAFVELLDGAQSFGPGRCRARCPAHESKRNSKTLSVAAGEDGRVLLACFAGCSALEIVEAMGLKLADLMPKSAQGPSLAPWRNHKGLVEGVRNEAVYVLLCARELGKGVAPGRARAVQKRLQEAVDRLEQVDSLLKGKVTSVPWLRHGTPIPRRPLDP